MAMDGTAMGDAIVAALTAAFPEMTADQIAQMRTSWEIVGQQIVAHIVANAVVTSTGADAQGGSVPSVGTVA